MTRYSKCVILSIEREVMSMKMTREQMMDNVIARYGFETRETINFCFLCERVCDSEVQKVYDYLMK